ATIDERLQIIRADKNFYEYIGFENFASIAENIHSEDLDSLKQVIAHLNFDEPALLVLRFMTIDKKYHHVLTELSKFSLEGEERDFIEIKILDIDILDEKLDSLYDENHIDDEFLDIWQEYLFMYDKTRDSFQVFNGGRLNRVYSFRGTLDKFREIILKGELVKKEHIPDFNDLCENIACGTKNFEHKLLFIDKSIDPERDIHFIKGRTIFNSHNEPIVLGCIQRLDNSSSSRSEYLHSDYDKDITTGLLTKKAIIEYTENLLHRKPKHNVNICILDIDNFKQVNDTLGHLFGDEVLATVSETIKNTVAGNGLVGRIGGDEIFIVLEGLNYLSDLRGVLRSVRSNVEWAYKDRKDIPKVTCSIGAATYPTDALVYDDLFKIADKMLYRAKQKGKNRYIIYEQAVHGDVLSEGASVSSPVNVEQKKNKQHLVMKMLEYLARQSGAPFSTVLREIGNTFDLDEIYLFYGDIQKVMMENYWNAAGTEAPAEPSVDYVNEENFVHIYNEHGMAVIDKIDVIKQLCPQTYDYLSKHDVKVALIYKMNLKNHEGYIAYYKKSEISRKWSESDIANLTYLSKTIELIFNDK
ncbi:MAG: GGDEF domain-containing protein, partial [Lachnospiraceae bacterium]|nr:GGDEF domain-containing protein [Lachnospiraceae bacterium]